ncbi:FeS-binding protein [Geomonas sp. RF6]|uniref:heterodisulfide reductase-related iron-sulfur binding cluster n=1 Tax=Geomonas sp. RF6 TaxID=2897342 RepID=UPI001E5A801C|nr:heterodisulfide reductase-related iron-sulfur binding cluster [Geomonas sp. RF6]UFS70619.1 FeS-binding protein [Geomonas sp. RF6]
MDDRNSKQKKSPQEILRGIIDLCADCDTCSTLLEEECVFFPELYRLWNNEKETGRPISDEELRHLVDLCTFCGLCPCPRIPADVMEAKSGYVAKEGLPTSTKLLIDVPRMAKVCGTIPWLYNALRKNKTVAPLLRKITDMHPDRELPALPDQSFFQWAEKKGLSSRKEGHKSVTYFAGCTAGYLFPQVGRAAVEVLEHNGVSVYVPKQECCGMPYLLEGDLPTLLDRVKANVDHLLPCVNKGDELVGSCSTCNFFMKKVMKERACYSDEYQKSVGASEQMMMIPDVKEGKKIFRNVHKAQYQRVLKDDGYFSSIPPLDRVAISEAFNDLGEYLARLHAEGKLSTKFGKVSERLVYFAPCHQREQKIGTPYLDLLRLIPGIEIDATAGVDCCGMGGNFGYKRTFHEDSMSIGRPLQQKIKKLNPQAIVTDCMSCKLQFNHTLPYPVYHPLEILAMAYKNL